ncbi:MAG: 50S ribosomal protein L4 [Nocardioides sp.]|nr:50S ribosomal protein L4 [Halobacteriovoraceae bacterium]MBS45552.1 50S ribosomal protein L4 [Nocardioides sp.]|tara:strand:+ start:761 stop:1378 length:618 start_codon:yes stop_codon:yes gene_type:complete
MAEITLVNSKFEKSGSLETNVSLDPEQISAPAVHQVVKATLAGRRQGNACTKNRAKVRGGGSKPFKQKGTGRARQGSSRSPIMVGGGTVFGPTPRDFAQKVNKKMMNKAIQSILADKMQAGKLTVVESFDSNGKTKEMFKTLTEKNLLPGLVVTEQKDSKAILAARNIRNAKAMAVEGFSVYEAVKFENLIIEKAALEKLLSRLG